MTPCHDKSGVHAAFPYRTYRTAFVTGAALTRGKRASTARSLRIPFLAGFEPAIGCLHGAFALSTVRLPCITPDSPTRCHQEPPQCDDWHHRLWFAMKDSNLRPWD